ncbi:DEAD/DEAH box helicase [Streptomyces chartreusis]|uniref:DEAD/DEAH box helicase n=1 Tax=Streptomyces chartreusis TaxID=1969 RepID=UPI003639F9AC
MLADIEIRAILKRFEVDDTVLATAWYLHGVCALPEAAELYTPVRRQRAAAVSAHIFDLALADVNRPSAERLSLAFAAQTGYRRAGQDPNATAVFRQVAALLHGYRSPNAPGLPIPVPESSDFQTLALEAGVAFLGLQTAEVRALVRHWRRGLSGLAADLQVPDLTGTMFGPAEAVVHAVRLLANFLTYGPGDRLDRAQTALLSVLDGTAGSGDLNARWVAAHLLDLLGDLADSSLHRLLPPDTPHAIAQAFTLTSPPVLTLWPPQRELLTRPTANPLDPATGRLLISVPTSAGKSLIAQLIMCTHLATVPGRVIYVSPLRSLSREMRRALRDRLRVLDRKISAETPDFPSTSGFSAGSFPTDSFGDVMGDDADIDVMTPERLMHALRHTPEVLNDVTLIVVDEAHHITQRKRGFLLEGLLALCQAVPSAPRLVLLSAAVGNGAALARWLDPHQPEILFTSPWRGPRRLHGLLTTHPLWEQKTVKPRRSEEWPETVTTPLVVDFSIRPAEAARVTTLTTSHDDPIGRLVLKRNSREQKRDGTASTAAYKMFAQAAVLLLPAGPMLVVCATPQSAQDTARAMTDALSVSEHEPARTLANLLAEQLGEEHPLVRCTRYGIAFHHAALPTDVLEGVEDALRNGVLKAVVSTTTLTDGVNLPVRTVVILAGLDSADGGGGSGAPSLDAAKLLNAVGRAGRAGRETEGWIFLALNRKSDGSDHALFTPSPDDLQVHSSLTSARALADLAEAEDLIARSADGLMDISNTIASDFISYVWLALDIHDHLTFNASPLQAVDRLLAMEQLSNEDKARWQRLAQRTQRRFDATPPGVRRRWTTTGTSLPSARALDELARRLAERVQRDADPDPFGMSSAQGPMPLSLESTFSILDQEDAFQTLLTLPEREKPWAFYNQRRGRRQEIQVNLYTAMQDWIAGTPIPELALRWLPEVAVDWRLEQTVKNISQIFEHYLSWTLGALVHLTNDHLAKLDATVQLRPDAPWCLRYGVDTEQALHLLTSGLHSRTLAHAIGRRANAELITTSRIRSWLANQHITGWREHYSPSDLGLEDLIEYVRGHGRSLLSQLLADGSIELSIMPREDAWWWAGGVVNFDWAESGPALAITIVDSDGTLLGQVRAEHHADLTAILRSGVPLAARLEDDRLRITRASPDD